MTSATIHGPRAASAKATTRPPEPPPVRTLLRAQTRHYERHVLAWYALGRVREARAAWAAVCDLRRRLADPELDVTPSTPALEADVRRS